MSNQQRPRRLYDALAVGSALAADLADLLTARGLSHLTLCSECGADDFTHELGCATFERVQREIEIALAVYGRTTTTTAVTRTT